MTKGIAEIPVGFSLCHNGALGSCVAEDSPEPEAISLLSIGRLSREKNLPFMLRAFAKARAACTKRLHLAIVGDGPERSSLEALALKLNLGGSVCFVGEVPNRTIGSFHSKSACLLFTSLTDVQAFVVCEAMLSGLPVVAVNAPGPGDFIADGVSGVLTGPREEEYASAICRVAESSELRQSMATNALAGSGMLKSKVYASKLISTYRELIDRFAEGEPS